MGSRLRTILALSIVSLLFVFHVHLKTEKIFKNPTWNPTDDVGQFWSEFAFHYRFAKFFAEHSIRDWGELAHDNAVQYPDTINVWKEFTVAMEVPAGCLYRVAQHVGLLVPPFHRWIVWYDCLVSSLSLFGIFLLGRELWRSDWAGVCSSLLYATLYPSYGRTVKNLFLREDFAIPLILFALAFTVRALHRQKVLDQVVAGLFWLVALASWHLTQFVLVIMVGAGAVLFLSRGKLPRIPWLLFVLVSGSLVVPVLFAKWFFFSPPMCVLYALTLAIWIDGSRRKQLSIFWGVGSVLVGASLLFKGSYGDYSHVYELFFYKIRYFGQKPDNPMALPWGARVLWEGAFNTAELKEFWKSLWFCLPIGIFVIIRRWWRVAGGTQMFLLFCSALFPLAWIVVRYFSFLGFAVSAVAAGLWKERGILPKLFLGLAIGLQFYWLDTKPLERLVPQDPASYQPAVQWLNVHAQTNAVILATISESPVFLAHTGRPIILHSKFENREIRERYRLFLQSIYSDEETFYDFAQKFNADYFIYDNGFIAGGIDSRRYKANQMENLDQNCAAMLFFGKSKQLKHFIPELYSERYSVYRVLH